MIDSSEAVLIGVDGGGSRCRVAIGTAADGILASVEGGPANFSTDPLGAIKTVLITVENAASKINVSQAQLAKAITHLGLAGVMTPDDSAKVADAMPFGCVTVTDDRPTAIAGALGESDGYLLSIGTGTIAAVSKLGWIKSVSGYGFHLSDHGSGAWLGRAALEQALLCHDGLKDHSDLTRTLLENFGGATGLVGFSQTAKPDDYAALAPDIVSAARNGDVWGKHLMRSGAQYLQQFLDVLGFETGETLCLSGGLGPHYTDYLPAKVTSGRIKPRGTALDGAFAMAKRLGAAK